MQTGYTFLITFILAWVVDHAIKITIRLIKKEKLGFWSQIFNSGGMPSSHSATTVSLATIIGLCYGFDSAIFAIGALFALVVMYDAVKVRRSSGEQGVAIRQLIKEQDSKVKMPRVALGHTPLEVFVGAILGVAIGYVVFLSAF